MEPEFVRVGRLFKTTSSNHPLPHSFPHRMKSEREKTWLKSSSSKAKARVTADCTASTIRLKGESREEAELHLHKQQEVESEQLGAKKGREEQITKRGEVQGVQTGAMGGGSPGRSTPASCSIQDKRGRDLCLAWGRLVGSC